MKYVILLLISLNAMALDYCPKKQQKIVDATIPYLNDQAITAYGGHSVYGLRGVAIICPKKEVFFAAEPGELPGEVDPNSDDNGKFDAKGNPRFIFIRAFKNGKLVETGYDTEKAFPEEAAEERRTREEDSKYLADIKKHQDEQKGK